MKLFEIIKDFVNRINGITTPLGGIQWNPKDKKQIDDRIIIKDENKKISCSTSIPRHSRWAGNWTDTRGFLFKCDIILNINHDGGVNGEIIWTLKSTPRSQEKVKIGLSATEYVLGEIDTEKREITIRGHRTDDPNKLIITDMYILSLSDDNRFLRGKSHNWGRWEGIIVAEHIQ